MDTTTQDKKVPTHTELRAKLDELRVRAHLGGMEAHDKLEALSREVAALGRKATRASKDAAHRLHQRIQELEAALILQD